MRAWRAFGMGAVLLAPLVGCGGGGRSTEAFCDRIADGQARIADTLEDRNLAYASTDDLLAQLGNAVEGMVELESDVLAMYRSMADAAPDEIRPQAERLAELYEQQVDRGSEIETSLAGVMAMLGESALGALRTSVELEQVDEFARENCGASAVPDLTGAAASGSGSEGLPPGDARESAAEEHRRVGH